MPSMTTKSASCIVSDSLSVMTSFTSIEQAREAALDMNQDAARRANVQDALFTGPGPLRSRFDHA
jgi:hypothetical protein